MMLKIELMLGNARENKLFELINNADSLIRIKKYEEAKREYEKSLEYGFEGKTIKPICTNGGNGLGTSVRDIKKLCPNSTVTKGLSIDSSEIEKAEDLLKEWLEK